MAVAAAAKVAVLAAAVGLLLVVVNSWCLEDRRLLPIGRFSCAGGKSLANGNSKNLKITLLYYSIK